MVELADGTIRPLAEKELIHPETLPPESKVVRADNLISQGYSEPLSQPFVFQGRSFNPGATCHWKTTLPGMDKLSKSGRLLLTGRTLAYKRSFGDFPVMMVNSGGVRFVVEGQNGGRS